MEWGAETTGLIVLVSLYWAYCLFCGLKGARSSRTIGDYFLAGRELPPWTFVLAVTAFSFSGWVLMSHPGLIHRDGFPYGYLSLGAIVVPLTGLLFLKRQWILGRRFGFVTPGEMFGHYFRSDAVRLLVLFVALVFSIAFISLLLDASGQLVTIVTDGQVSRTWTLLVIAAFLLIYVASGGLRAVAEIGALQSILLVIVIVVIGLIVLHAAGGWEGLTAKIALLAGLDAEPTRSGDSGYLAVPGVIQLDADPSSGADVSSGADASSGEGGVWTSTMILTSMLALMGLQAAPAFSILAFASRDPAAFAPQQVAVSSFAIGFVLIFFSTITGLGSHVAGTELALAKAHPDQIATKAADHLQTSTLRADPGNVPALRDVPNRERDDDSLVPELIDMAADTAPWLTCLLAACALAAMQATAAVSLSAAGTMLSRDFIKRFLLPSASPETQILVARIGVALVLLSALLVATAESHVGEALIGLALAYGFQLWPALIAVCFWPYLTRLGAVLGLIAGLTTVTLTGQSSADWLGIGAWIEWGRWPLTVHAAGWGIIANLAVALSVSALSRDHRLDLERKQAFHETLREHAALPVERQPLVPMAWIIALAWFFFAVGPGVVIGNWIFGDPNSAASWFFGIPSIWAWQILFWVLGVGMMWFLAHVMQMSTGPETEIEALADDVTELDSPQRS